MYISPEMLIICVLIICVLAALIVGMIVGIKLARPQIYR